MCGVSALFGRGDPAVLAAMTGLQRHRGPDDRGTWDRTLPDGTYLGLGSNRLSIRDLSPAGHMPMVSDDGSVALAYNGELYNAAELRRDLEARGHRFRSGSDTEVVLRLLHERGADAVPLLEGMFALAAVDLRDDPPAPAAGTGPTVLLARDPFGVKPLRYVHEGDTLAAASEAHAFRALPDFAAAVDLRSLHRYLTFLWVPEPETLLRGVRSLPPAHLATLRGGRLDVRPYWEVPLPPAEAPFPLSGDEVLEGLRERLGDSVRRQMVSDVPLGAFLSAGIDSSAIVAFMAEASPEPVRTFTVTFPPPDRVGESTLDDPAVARRVADAFGCRHREIVVEPDVVDLLPRLVTHTDSPLADPAMVMAHLVCRAAREDVTVLLSGVGGDELFAGYRKHAADRLARRWRRIPAPVRRGILEPALSALPAFRGTPLMGPARLARKWARTASLPPEEAFLSASVYLDGRRKAALYAPDVEAALAGEDPASIHRGHLERSRGADFVNRMLDLDLRTFMPGLNLAYTDRMSMAVSLEVRVPFLHRPLVEFAFGAVPPRWKVTDGLRPRTKAVLRDAVRGLVPDEVLRQPKAGFGAPHDRWLVTDLRGMVDDLLSESEIRRRGLFDPAAVRALVEGHRAGRASDAYAVWALLTLELWQRAHVDGSAPGVDAADAVDRAPGAALPSSTKTP